MDFQVGVGASQVHDGKSAGKEAATKALQAGKIQQPSIWLVMASAEYDHQAILNGVLETANAPLVGGSSGGEIANAEALQYSVVVGAIKSNDVKFYNYIVNKFNQDQIKAGKLLADQLNKIEKKQNGLKALLLWFDGIQSQGNNLLQGLDSFRSNIVINGVGTGDSEDFSKSYQYFNNQVFHDSVVGLAIQGELVVKSMVLNNWHPLGNKLSVTKVEKNVLYEINNMPALEVYKKYIGAERSLSLPAVSWEYPLAKIIGNLDSNQQAMAVGQALPQPVVEPRPIVRVDDKNQSLILNADLNEGDELTIAAVYRHDLLMGSEVVGQLMRDSLLGARVLMGINFHSLGRRMMLGQRASEEITRIREAYGKDIPMIGMYGFGEIGSTTLKEKSDIKRKFYNESAVVMVLATHSYEG